MKNKTVYFETYGCQMNKYDSDLIEEILLGHNFIKQIYPQGADVIIVNTCSIRENAKSRALARLRELAVYRKDGAILIIAGCVASEMGDKLFELVKIDLAVGPDNYKDLPDFIEKFRGKKKVINNLLSEPVYEDIFSKKRNVASKFVTIMRGCNNFCSYCIVPYVRGREKSRSKESIVKEVSFALENGCKEIILLGQNVNSYIDKDLNFPKLLREINNIPIDFRLKFMTSHPKDFSDELILAMAECKKVLPHIHLPIQSGCDKILTLMNRKYTSNDYLVLVDKVRKAITDVSITTDIIVGFPNETDADFNDTLNIIKKVRFEEAFTYMYSVRKGTEAEKLNDTLNYKEKQKRLNDLILVQREITKEIYSKLIGLVFNVLIEKQSAKNKDQWLGRTQNARPVIITNKDLAPGMIKNVKILNSTGSTLIGEVE